MSKPPTRLDRAYLPGMAAVMLTGALAGMLLTGDRNSELNPAVEPALAGIALALALGTAIAAATRATAWSSGLALTVLAVLAPLVFVTLTGSGSSAAFLEVGALALIAGHLTRARR